MADATNPYDSLKVDLTGQIAVVTGASQGLGKAIAMAYVPTESSTPGTELAVDVRGNVVDARVVTLPFHSRKR